MSPIQTSYSENMERLVNGMIQGSDYNTGTGIATDADIAFGKPVGQKTGVERGVIAAATLAAFMGITVRDIAVGAEVEVTPRYKNLAYLKQGQIAVISSVDGIVPGDPVWFDPGNAGAWKKATGGTNVGPIVGARYVSAGDTNDLVIIELQAK